ncbi:MAG: glycine cleavage system transcriptional repressor [Frankiaceae bacterium]|jgi:glycine cleavage system transcriptional repressor|nr:glycine cleavage system transcriptional repressor [Frankiaceae bacterium]
MADTGEIALTVMGADRVGIIAGLTSALADLGSNIEDSSMTILRGHFAMTLIISTSADAEAVRAAVAPVAASLELLVDVRAVAPGVDGPDGPDGGVRHTLVVQGADRPRIVAQIMSVVAAHGGNVTDLTTRLVGAMYLLVAEVDLRSASDADALSDALSSAAAALGVDASLRPAEVDVL